MAVLRPLKLTITNYPEDKVEAFTVENNPNRPEDGEREVSFSRSLWVEQEDFLEETGERIFSAFPGNEVRLKGAYVVGAPAAKDADGRVTEVLAEYDPATRGGNTPDGRRIKGTIHWVDLRGQQGQYASGRPVFNRAVS